MLFRLHNGETLFELWVFKSILQNWRKWLRQVSANAVAGCVVYSGPSLYDLRRIYQLKVDSKIKLYRMSTWIKAYVGQLLIRLLWGSSDSFNIAESIFLTSKLSAKRQLHNIESSWFEMCSVQLLIINQLAIWILSIYCTDPNLCPCLCLCPTDHTVNPPCPTNHSALQSTRQFPQNANVALGPLKGIMSTMYRQK